MSLSGTGRESLCPLTGQLHGWMSPREGRVWREMRGNEEVRQQVRRRRKGCMEMKKQRRNLVPGCRCEQLLQPARCGPWPTPALGYYGNQLLHRHPGCWAAKHFGREVLVLTEKRKKKRGIKTVLKGNKKHQKTWSLSPCSEEKLVGWSIVSFMYNSVSSDEWDKRYGFGEM